MIQNTIAEIESKIRKADSVKEENKSELLNLIANLRSEIAELSRTHQQEAEMIAGRAQRSAQEATREQKNPELVKSALDDLSASVAEFETSHPHLVQVVNRICVTLSNIGI